MALIWGTLCLLDTVPHEALTAEQEATLVDLAAMIVSELELRLAAQQIASVDAALVEITQGVSRVTGGEFLDELVRHFAKVLGADYVYIGLVEGIEPKMMRTMPLGIAVTLSRILNIDCKIRLAGKRSSSIKFAVIRAMSRLNFPMRHC